MAAETGEEGRSVREKIEKGKEASASSKSSSSPLSSDSEEKSLDLTLLEIAAPALVALAADPLASLVDISLVGKLGSEPLAEVGVATSILNLASKIITTPLLAVTTTQVLRTGMAIYYTLLHHHKSTLT